MAETNEPGIKTPEAQAEHQKKHGLGGVLLEFWDTHRIVVIGAAIGIAVVVFIMSRKGASNNSSTSQTGASGSQCLDSGGNVVDCSSPTAVTNQQGSLAGYQNSNTAFALDAIQTQLNNLAATVSKIGTTTSTGTTSTGTGTTTTTTPQPAPKQTPTSGALLPWGSKISLSGGTFMATVNGATTPLVGPKGLFWGVPNLFQHQGNWFYIPSGQSTAYPVISGSAQQFNPTKGTPLPPTYKPPVTNSQANHSPMLSSLMLSQASQGGQDLSHPGISGGGMQFSPVSRIYPTWGSH